MYGRNLQGVRKPLYGVQTMSDSAPSTFVDTMAALALLAEEAITPPERAQAAIVSLRHLGEAGGARPLTMADAAVGFSNLAHTLEGTEHRFQQTVCRVFSQLAVLAGDPQGGNAKVFIEVFFSIQLED